MKRLQGQKVENGSADSVSSPGLREMDIKCVGNYFIYFGTKVTKIFHFSYLYLIVLLLFYNLSEMIRLNLRKIAK